MTVETLKVLCAEDVRRCCIDHKWYDTGDNESYSAMLEYVEQHSTRMHILPRLKYVAEDIISHTGVHAMEVTDVMKTLLGYFKVSLYLYKDEDD